MECAAGGHSSVVERLPSKHPRLTAVPQKPGRKQNPPSYPLFGSHLITKGGVSIAQGTLGDGEPLASMSAGLAGHSSSGGT